MLHKLVNVIFQLAVIYTDDYKCYCTDIIYTVQSLSMDR